MESAVVTRNRDMDQLNILIDVGSAIRRVILEKYVLASTSRPTANI